MATHPNEYPVDALTELVRDAALAAFDDDWDDDINELAAEFQQRLLDALAGQVLVAVAPADEPTVDEKMQCAVCRKQPHEIAEYITAVAEFNEDCVPQADDIPITFEQYIRQEEGTFNPANNLFACTACYIKIGMPSGAPRWCPDGFIDARSSGATEDAA